MARGWRVAFGIPVVLACAALAIVGLSGDRSRCPPTGNGVVHGRYVPMSGSTPDAAYRSTLVVVSEIQRCR